MLTAPDPTAVALSLCRSPTLRAARKAGVAQQKSKAGKHATREKKGIRRDRERERKKNGGKGF